jgi:hypothetical protein
MQKIKYIHHARKAVLSAALLGVGAAVSFPQIAQAASRDVKEARHDVKEAKRDVKDAKKDVRRADSKSERRDAREDLRDARSDRKDARHDLRQEKREDKRDNKYDNHWNSRDNHWDHKWSNNRNYSYHGVPGRNPYYGYDNRNNSHRNGYNNSYNTFVGTVTNVKSNQSFEIRVNGHDYDVYSNSHLPRGLNRGDTVRVYGVRSGNNDIRNAGVALIRNR